MQKMNYWGQKWDLTFPLCPCDVHFNEWIEERRITGKTIYHFGTGTHHLVGARQSELGNCVFAITASKEEYESYEDMVIDNAKIAKSYIVYFGDVYLTNVALLPEFDIVTLFHLGEFISENTTSAQYGGLDDRGVIDALTGRTRAGGYILLYPGSDGWEVSEPIVAAWEKNWPVEKIGMFKTLLIYRKNA